MNDSKTALAQAAELDALGDHDEAVNVLARATQAGDLAAMTRLGKRLLVGDNAPYLPKDGARFIVDAANRSFAEAVAMVAVMQATGVYQRKSWPDALNTLALAAALGWEAAREQLVLLAEAGEPASDPSLTDDRDPEFWKRYPAQVDLGRWLSVPAGRVLHDDPLVKSVPDLLPGPLCRLLIRLSASRLKPALVYDAVNKRNYRSSKRTNSVAEFNLVENELVHFLAQERMAAACGIPIVQMEATAILNYQPGEEIDDHYDFVDPDLPNYQQEIAENGQRIITFLIYLNDAYSSGETAFPKLDVCHKGKTGEGLYFVNALSDGSPDLRAQHAGRPPQGGEKWIVSQFVRNRPVKYVV